MTVSHHEVLFTFMNESVETILWWFCDFRRIPPYITKYLNFYTWEITLLNQTISADMISSWVPVFLSWICVIQLKISSVMNNFDEGYCQVYSYNIKDRRTGMSEKHFFSCCNNLEEKSCQGYTYQKPNRRECKYSFNIFSLINWFYVSLITLVIPCPVWFKFFTYILHVFLVCGMPPYSENKSDKRLGQIQDSPEEQKCDFAKISKRMRVVEKFGPWNPSVMRQWS